MKRFFLSTLLLTGSLGLSHGQEPILETPEPIQIDGSLDEAVWKTAPAVEVNYIGSKKGEKSADPRMTARYAWDGNYLYIAYETFDANLVALGSNVTEGSPETPRAGAAIFQPDSKVDVVEFFVSFGDEHFQWEIHQNALNQFNDIFCVIPAPEWPVAKSSLAAPHGIIFCPHEWIGDDGALTVASAVKLKPKADGRPSTINDPSDVDSGYTAEIRLPWRSIGAPNAAATWIENKPNPRVPGPWKMAGQTISLLAVVQDGDLKERYHHSSATRPSGWFQKTQPEWPVYEFTSAEAMANRAAVEEFVTQVDAGNGSTVLVDELQKRGVAAAIAAAGFLDEAKPERARALYEVITLAANSRRLNAELLRLYEPAAFELFYQPAGQANQNAIAAALAWKEWPPNLPDALVRAAPLPLLDWLNAQAASSTPDLPKLRAVFASLGWWLRAENERKYAGDFRKAIAALIANPTLTHDPATAAALLKLTADAGALPSVKFVWTSLRSPEQTVRLAAAEALGRLEAQDGTRDKAVPEFVQMVRAEKDPLVLAKLAAAAEAWPENATVGQAMLDLFKQTQDADVQRSILFAVINTRWPNREAILLQALTEPTDGVLGVALEAASFHPSPNLLPPVQAFFAEQVEPQAQLIDAVGALHDAEAVPKLRAWLEKERNPAVRLKLLIALSQIPGKASDEILLQALTQAAEPMEADALCRIAGQRTLPGATAVLSGLAEDLTAPLPIRAEAIWALGNDRSPEARDCLTRLSEKAAAYFPDNGKTTLVPETLEQIRLFVDLARLRQGDSKIEAEVVRRFSEATPATQVAVLQAMAGIKADSPVIESSLRAGEFAVLQAAVIAAHSANPAKYQAQLTAIRKTPFMNALLNSGMDTWKLPRILDAAIQAGNTSPKSSPQ